MTLLDRFFTFMIKQLEDTESEQSTSEKEPTSEESVEDRELTLEERHQGYKDLYQSLMSQKESLDKVASSKESKDSSYERETDSIYTDKIKQINSTLAKIKAGAKDIGTILEIEVQEESEEA